MRRGPFYADSFETLHVLLSWSQLLYNPEIVPFFQDVNLQLYQFNFIYKWYLVYAPTV